MSNPVWQTRKPGVKGSSPPLRPPDPSSLKAGQLLPGGGWLVRLTVLAMQEAPGVVIAGIVPHNATDHDNTTITEGFISTIIPAQGRGLGLEEEAPRQDAQTSLEDPQLGPRCRGESGAGSGQAVLSFLFVLICLRSSFTF